MVGSVPRFDVATGSPAKQRADLLLLPAFQGPEAGPGVREVGRALDVEITALLEENGFRGSLGEISTLPTLGRGEARTVAVLGLGPKDEATSERIRRAAGRAAATAGRYKTVAATVPAGGKGPWRGGGGGCLKADLEKGGFGGIIGVGRGSENPPRLIELRYEGGGRGKPVALTGKGVTFDSGGLSIKDAKQMEWMKSDMAGAPTMPAATRGNRAGSCRCGPRTGSRSSPTWPT